MFSRGRTMGDPFPDEIDEVLWDKACRRSDAIRQFLRGRVGNGTTAEVSELAAEMEVSPATAYRLIKLFRGGGTVLSLVERKRGRSEGHRTLDEKRERLI
jgi:putative transposase